MQKTASPAKALCQGPVICGRLSPGLHVSSRLEPTFHGKTKARSWGVRLPAQTLRIMKLTGFLLIVFCLHLSARSVSQAVTFSGKEVHLRKVFGIIEKQTGYVVFGNRQLIAASKPITVSVKNMPLNEFLRLVFEEQPLSYRLDNQTIVLSRRQPVLVVQGTPPQRDTTPAFVLVTGVVKDEKDEPISGATVMVKGTTRGVSTLPTGRFTILTPPGTALVISSVGFSPYELTVRAAGNHTITLQPAVSKLNDVVVTGIFSRRTESFTGSAQTYTRDELLKVGAANVLQSLKNIDPSFNIRENLEVGSNPNALPSIQLRGQSGFPDLRGEYQIDPNQPLFILDGFEVPLTRVIDLDMNRVESVTLLKDASAKAIYGSKAANGVVVIETQRPKSGKMQVTYTGKVNVNAPDLSSYNLTNAAEKLDVEKSAGLYTVSNPVYADRQYLYDKEYNRILEEVLSGVNTDWLSKPVRTGLGQKHALYVEGGSEFMRYGVDLSYNNVKGVMKGSDRTTTAGVVTLTYRKNNLLFRNSLDVSYNKGTNSPWGNFSDYASMNPYFRATDERGRITRIAGENMVTGGVVGNPLWNSTINTKDFTEYTQIINNFNAEWTVKPGLRIVGRASITRKESGNETFFPASHTMFLNYTTEELAKRKGQYIQGDGTDYVLYSDINGNYSFNTGDHSFFVNAGWSMNNATSRYMSVATEGFPNDYLEDITFARQYALNSRPTGTENTIRDLGLLSFLNYAYADKYLADISFRMSGSSQFGSDNRWGKFWSAGLGWNVHRENFASGWNNVDMLKIRGSVGYTGSQNFNSYQAKSTFSYDAEEAYLGHYGAYLLGHGNQALKWQRKYDQNIGVDLSMLNRALTFRADYYVSNTNDLLTDVTIPSSTGFTSYKENLGRVQNTGVELRVGYRVWHDKRRGNYINVFAAATHNRNRIQEISNSLATFNKDQAAIISNRPVTRYAEGQSLSAIWAVPSYGIDPASGREIFVLPDGSITHVWDAANLAVVGDAEPVIRGNAGFNVDYNGWALNVSMNWKFGGQVYNQTVVSKVENANTAFNVDRRIFSDRWRNPGDITFFKDIRNRATTRATQRFVEDQDEWVFSALSLSYDLHRLAVFKSSGIQRLRAIVNVNDAAILSSVRIERGTAYPFARTFDFTIQATF